MTNEEKMAAIYWWQNGGIFHQLTCLESKHNPLRAIEKNGDIALECPTCGHIQIQVPDCVYSAYENREQIEKEMRHLFKL